MRHPDESGPYVLVREPVRPQSTEKQQGIAASPGIAVGRAFVLDRRRAKTPKRHIAPEEVEAELVRLDEAVTLADLQFERLKRKLRESEQAATSGILEAYQLILHDEYLLGPTRRRIRDEKLNAEWGLRKTVDEIKQRFDAIGIEYFRERRSDVEFVGEQVLRNLMGGEGGMPPNPPPGAIVVAHDLSPADTVNLHRNSVAAFVTDAGGRTSHTAILAQAFSIPAVVGLDNITDKVGTGDLLIVDGSRGEVILCPTPEQVEEYRHKALWQHRRVAELLRNRDQPAETKDGVRVRLLANIELPDEVPVALDHGAEGIGLYRTEFLFLDRTDFPREEEHFMHARGVLRRVAPFPATFRTFDLGADKIAPFLARTGTVPLSPEPNPALGLRSLRLCLKERQLFKAQLRGLLRASVHGRMRLMFPMVSGLGELREAKAVLEECKDELRREGIAFAEDLPIGIMIEMPSAVMIADHLAREADFLSIGTNDLIQYSLALDRVNEHVGYLYQPLHPAVLRMVKHTVEAGHAAGRRVGMCGEMAGEPLYTLVLLGLQLDDLSMNATSVPVVKNVIRSATLREARQLAEEVLTMGNHEDIERLVRERMAAYMVDRDLFCPPTPKSGG
ncbi:MAG: phosphoenolpyruvate--protein phosphotransferase [Myxococcales bacterium]|nr:phosphoenolpyruvate--protein phosphotransferase [Myxococcota bacterium]MDW8284047.1 phosphoenolpyruvate--protein phosphotransferase [Myxococcales bacterium]